MSTTDTTPRRLPCSTAWGTRQLAMNNKASGGHFFDADTLRFFSSRIGASLRAGDALFFITSERDEYGAARYGNSPRLYTVRASFDEGRTIQTVGEFQQHATRDRAMGAMKRHALAYVDGVCPLGFAL